jgi:hypothetical protein
MHRFTEINVNAEKLCGNWSFLPKLATRLGSTRKYAEEKKLQEEISGAKGEHLTSRLFNWDR